MADTFYLVPRQKIFSGALGSTSRSCRVVAPLFIMVKSAGLFLMAALGSVAKGVCRMGLAEMAALKMSILLTAMMSRLTLKV